MDEKQQKQINEAAEKFAEAIRDSYQAASDRVGSAQELNSELTQNFFNQVINNLQTQAEGNQELAQTLVEHQKKQREAAQELAQQSMNAYTDLLNSMFAYYQGSVEQEQKGSES